MAEKTPSPENEAPPGSPPAALGEVSQTRWEALVWIAVVVGVGVVLFFANFHSNPLYYVDEATNSYLGRMKLETLLSGAPMRIGPVKYADYPRMSGYTFLVGLIGKVTRDAGFASRYLSGICGIGFAVLILLVARIQLVSRLAIAVVVGTFLSSNVALIEFRYGFNCELIAMSLMATYYFSLLLLLKDEAAFGKRLAWTIGASLAACLTLLNELFSGAAACLLVLGLMAVQCLHTRRRDKRNLLLIAVPVAFDVGALAILFSNPLFVEEVRRMLGPRSPVGQLTLKDLYWNLCRALESSPLLRLEWVFLSISLVSLVFAIVSLARTKRLGHLLAFAALLGPFVFITTMIGDRNFYNRAISMYFPVFFASLILIIRSAEKTEFWRQPHRSPLGLAARISLGLLLLAGAAERIQGVHAYFAKPQKYFNDIPFDANFRQAAAQAKASVARNQLLLVPPHLLPFVDHPYTTDYFLSQLCAGRRHAIYAPDTDTISERLLYHCQLRDVHVAVLHPVFYENDARSWPDGPAIVRNIVTTWELLGSVGDFAIFRNPSPSSPSVRLIDQR